MTEKPKIYGVWVDDRSAPHGGGWMKDASGRIYEHLSKGAATSLAREWGWPNARVAEIGDDGFPVLSAPTTQAEG